MFQNQIFQQRLCAALMLCLFSAFPAFAQSQSPAQSTSQDNSTFGTMQPIVVSPTLFPMPEDQIGSSVTVISADQIQQQQDRTLAQVLTDVPGLIVVQNGGVGGTATVFIRGADSNHTKVLVDGVDVSDPSSPSNAFDFSQLTTGGIDQVEVLRGPQSGLYGSDAIGGVINIVTKQGSGPPLYTGMVEGGSFGTFNQSAGVSGSAGRANYAFSVDHLHYDDIPVTPANLLSPGETAIGDAFGKTSYSTKLGADLTDNLSVGLVAHYTNSLLHYTGTDDIPPSYSGPDSIQSEQVEQTGYARGTAKLLSFDGALEDEVGVAYTRYHSVFIVPDSQLSISDGDRTKMDWHGTLHLGQDRTVELGVEDEEDRLIGDQPINATMNDSGGFAEYHTPIFDRLFANITGRIDSNNRFGNAYTYRFAPAYFVPGTGTQLKASYGTGFKAPSLQDLFVSYPSYQFYANPNLLPEKSSGYDLGFEQPVLGKNLDFGATLFHNDIKNLIQTTEIGSSGNYTLTNVATATTEGVETFFDVKPVQRLDLRADYTYTFTRNETTGQELLNRPLHKASFNAIWNPIDPLSLTANWLFVGARLDDNRDASSKDHLNSYSVVNLAADYKLGPHMTLFGRIDNLLDRHYEDPDGFLAPPLGVFAGLRVSWGGE